MSCREQSASEALAALATVRSLMAHGGVPKEAQAARIVVADAQQGRIVVATAPPGIDQRAFDLLGHNADEDVGGARVVLVSLIARRVLKDLTLPMTNHG